MKGNTVNRYDHWGYRGEYRFVWYAVTAVVVAVLLVGGLAWHSYGTEHHRQVVVTRKERVDHKYLVYTDTGTFQVADSFHLRRWDSSDVYGDIAVCHRYNIMYIGWRVPALSAYPNIGSIEDLGPVSGCVPDQQ